MINELKIVTELSKREIAKNEIKAHLSGKLSDKKVGLNEFTYPKLSPKEIIKNYLATAENVEGLEKTNKLTEIEKLQIKNETGWTNEIINSLHSMKEYEIYKKIGLKEANINGKPSLIRTDINWERKDSMGRTNLDRAKSGLSPINNNGETIELHHIGQKNDSPLAELTPEEHRGKENYLALHDPTKESTINREAFSIERAEHWKQRAKEQIGG